MYESAVEATALSKMNQASHGGDILMLKVVLPEEAVGGRRGVATNYGPREAG
jgi:hypothetical protein